MVEKSSPAQPRARKAKAKTTATSTIESPNNATDAPPKPTTQQVMAEGARDLQVEAVKAAKGRPGQPTKFTPELWEEIIDRLACNENIADICDEEGMPSFYTVRKWWRANPELKRDVEEAWQDAAYFLHYINDSMLSGGRHSTGDFRRDEARANNNRWFMGKAHRRIFGDKQTVDLTQTVHISMPQWGAALPFEIIEDGETIDPDAVYERETVERITTVRADTLKPD